MLGGIAPILIIELKKNIFSQDSTNTKLIPQILEYISLPKIPIYLDEKLTGILIESEAKNIDMDTTPLTDPEGKKPDVIQRGINSSVTINMKGSKDSVGITILLALIDLLFVRAASKEYSITYISGAVTVFSGLLDSFSVNQDKNTSLYDIQLVLNRSNDERTKEAPTTGFGIPSTGNEKAIT